ncbi:MAG TPA: alpha/beta hydrolase [Mycobacterium sp.]|nr:alpha/beta hydrolase [Mycobacterium sp.]
MASPSDVTDNLPSVAGVTHRWVSVGSLTVHVACAEPQGGAVDRVPVVLVHGWPQHWWCWRQVIGPLSRDRAVYAVDLRGHGWTTTPPAGYDKFTLADDLAETIKTMGLEQIDLVGHDWGGWISLLAAAEHPELVRRVVAVAIPAPWWRPSRTLNPALVYLYLAGGRAGVFLHRRLKQIFLRIVLRVSRADRLHRRPKSEVEPYLERFRHPARAHAGMELYRTFVTQELGPYTYGRYSPKMPEQPVLLLPAQHDPVNKPSQVAKAVASGANIECQVIPDSGHMVPEEQPEELIRRVRGFLDRP